MAQLSGTSSTACTPSLGVPCTTTSDEEEQTPLQKLLRDDTDHFLSLTEQLLNLLARPANKISPQDLAKRQGTVQTLLHELDVHECTVRRHAQLAQRHGRDHARLVNLQHEVRLRDRRIQSAIEHLYACQDTLGKLTSQAQIVRDQMHHAEQHPLPLESTLSYAARLAGVTSAPPEDRDPRQAESDPHKPPLASKAAHYPFPDEGLIRNGAFALGLVARVIPLPPEEGAPGASESHGPLPAGSAGGADAPLLPSDAHPPPGMPISADMIDAHTGAGAAQQPASGLEEEMADDAFDLDL